MNGTTGQLFCHYEHFSVRWNLFDYRSFLSIWLIFEMLHYEDGFSLDATWGRCECLHSASQTTVLAYCSFVVIWMLAPVWYKLISRFLLFEKQLLKFWAFGYFKFKEKLKNIYIFYEKGDL